jgi:hypothetical protein
LPYVSGYLAQTPELHFGGAVLDKPDYQSHLAKMWQGYRGHWRYRLLFTPEDHEGAFLQTFYVALGHLARLTSLSLPATYQLARVLLGFVMLLTIYRFVAQFLSPVRLRRIAFLLATTASGLGWLKEIIAPTAPGGVSPMSFWLIDAYTYLSLLTFPHFCLAITLLLSIFLLLLREPEGPSPKGAAAAALASVGLGIVHPYMLIVADLVPALYWVVDGLGTRRMRRGFLALAAMGVIQAPILAYDLWVFRTNPVFAAWSAQNMTLSPPPWIYLFGYGPLLLLGFVEVGTRRRGAIGWSRFLWIWIAVVTILVHLPWNLQRRFLEGVQVPMGIVATLGLTLAAGRIRHLRIRRTAPIAVVGLLAIGNTYLTVGLIWSGAARNSILFWPDDVIEAVDWLGTHTSWRQTVLTSPETGGLIPARIGHQVVIGHEMETINYDHKREAVQHFYGSDTASSERLAIMRRWQVDSVVCGPNEQSLNGLEVSAPLALDAVFTRGDVTIYAARPR